MAIKVRNLLIKIILIIMLFQNIFMPISNAGFWDDIKSNGESFISTGKDVLGDDTSNDAGVNQVKLNDTINKVYNALLALGVVVSVLIGAILGLKAMVGSVEEQAKIKEMMIPYVTGCIVTFCAFGIWKVLMEVLSTL